VVIAIFYMLMKHKCDICTVTDLEHVHLTPRGNHSLIMCCNSMCREAGSIVKYGNNVEANREVGVKQISSPSSLIVKRAPAARAVLVSTSTSNARIPITSWVYRRNSTKCGD
jgi:hypothetical protein